MKFNLLKQVNTDLEHFLIINYLVDPIKVATHIHSDFELDKIIINDKSYVIVSAVPFKDKNFRSKGLFSFFKQEFWQTNYRTYVINKKTKEKCVWFFGTSLGSFLVLVPKLLWKLPWHYGSFYFQVDQEKYSLRLKSKFSNNQIEIKKTQKKVELKQGFADLETMLTSLTDLLIGYYYRRDNQVGTYSIHHPRMEMYEASANFLYFSLFEDLKLLSASEMQNPHSIFSCEAVPFEIYLPPKLK